MATPYRIKEVVENFIDMFPVGTTIYANGAGSPELGRLSLVDGKVKLQQRYGEQYVDITSSKPGNKPFVKLQPSEELMMALEYHLNQAENAERQRYAEMGRNAPDITPREISSYREGRFIGYGDALNPNELDSLTVAFADDIGVYLLQSETSQVQLPGSPLNLRDSKQIKARVFRYIVESQFDEELVKLERQRDYDEMIDVIKRIPRRSIVDAMTKDNVGQGLTDDHARQHTDTDVTVENGIVKVKSTVIIMTGVFSDSHINNRNSRKDARYISSMVYKLDRVPLDSSGIYLKRKGYPKIMSASKGSEVAKLGYSHVVGAEFIAEFPEELLPKVYENNKSLVR